MMIKRKTMVKRERRFYLAALPLFLALLLVLQTIPPLSAATTTPFDGQQVLYLGDKAGMGFLFYQGSGLVVVTERRNPETGKKELLAEGVPNLDENGRGEIAWTTTVEYEGGEVLQLVHPQEKGFVAILKQSGNKGTTNRMVKIDSEGKIAWENILPLEQVAAVDNTNDKGLILLGTTLAPDRNSVVCLLKMDEEGDWFGSGQDASRWLSDFSSSDVLVLNDVTQVLDNEGYNQGYILTGCKKAGEQKDLYLLRIGAYGEFLWDRNYGNTGENCGWSVQPLTQKDGDQALLTAGYIKRNSAQGRDLYLLHTGMEGVPTRWPGLDRAIDGLAEKIYGTGRDETGLAVFALPNVFRGSRSVYNASYEGMGGALLVGMSTHGTDTRLELVRVTDEGRDQWHTNVSIPGKTLMMANPAQAQTSYVDIAYSWNIPEEGSDEMEVYVLRLFRESEADNDKTRPKEDQQFKTGENLKWQRGVLRRVTPAADKSAAIKRLLAQQTPPPGQKQPITGLGDIEWPDTSYYLGKLTAGQADGEGTLLFPDGVWYKGQWKNNMFNGRGTLRFPTGEYYEGEFKDHAMCGQGVFRWPTGESYRGQFKLNKREGQGTFTWPKGVVYQGGFVEDKAEGMGSIRWSNGERYEGQMKGGQATGNGSYFFPSGEWYRGEFKGLKFEGVGVYHWPDGSYYVGEFKNDRLNGEGYYIWPNGVQVYGYWKDDRFLGKEPAEMYKTPSAKGKK